MILASLSSKGQFDIFVELGGVGGVGGGDGPLVEGGGDSSQGEKVLPFSVGDGKNRKTVFAVRSV